MLTLSSIARMFDVRLLGTCPTCMRISFLAMILSWAFVLGALLFDLNAQVLISVASIGLTLLWLAHIITRAKLSIPHDRPENHSRRLAIRTIANAAVGAAVMTVAFPWQAHAISGCGGWSGSSCPNKCTSCERQNADCECYTCRSCGSTCVGDC